MKRPAINWRVRGAVMAASFHRHDDAFICNWCCARLDADAVVIDHILPVAKGGTNDRENLTVSCERCNQIKRDKLPDCAELAINAHMDRLLGLGGAE